MEKTNFLTSAGSAVTTLIIFGKMHFLLISENEFFMKLNKTESQNCMEENMTEFQVCKEFMLHTLNLIV